MLTFRARGRAVTPLVRYGGSRAAARRAGAWFYHETRPAHTDTYYM